MTLFRQRASLDDELYNENVARLRDALTTSIAKREELARFGTEDQLRIVNIVQFAILWNADLSSLLDDLRRLSGATGDGPGWKRKLTARLLALTMVECAEDFSALLGKQFRDSVQTLCADPSLVDKINRVHKGLNEFRKMHDKQLRDVRNTVIAHRDPDASVQIESLRKLSVEHLQQLGLELLRWTNDLLSVLTSVVAAAQNGPSVVR